MAILIIGGTLLAGGGASVVRRRNRRKAERAQAGATATWPATSEIMNIDPVMRTDRIRRALRAGLAPPASEYEPLQQLFEIDATPALRVLVLEALAKGGGETPVALLEKGLGDEADSVRSAALHRLMLARPERMLELARAHLYDPGIEARAQCADVLADVDPEAAARAMLDIVRVEALGPRESHVLRRAMGFFAEELQDPAWAPEIEALREEVEDDEEMIDWALEQLRRA
jgi:HEAT repeat protein